MTNHYYECHVTTDPVFDETTITKLDLLAAEHTFRRAELFKGSGEPSDRDMFFTARSMSFADLLECMNAFLLEVASVVKLRRVKIESIIMDERFD